MADSRRVKKVADSIRRAVSEILEFKVKDPRRGFVTVTGVKVSPDLRIASVYYTVLGDAGQKENTRLVLDRSVSFIRNELKPFVRTRWLPELRFFYDESQEEAEKLEQLLKKIKSDADSQEE